MVKLLSYNEVEKLPPDKQEKYKQRVKDALALLAKYEPLTSACYVLEQGGCWGMKLKIRTPLGNHFEYTSGPESKPSKDELRRRRAEAKAAYEAEHAG